MDYRVRPIRPWSADIRTGTARRARSRRTCPDTPLLSRGIEDAPHGDSPPWSAFASRNRGDGKSGGTRDEIGLWTADPGARSGADLRRAGQPDGRADAPLLAAGLHIGRTARPSEEGKLLCEEIVVFRDKNGRVG